jgi:PKD repeat protein
MSARFILTLIVLILLAPTPVFAAVMLGEIQIAGDKASDEFVELYNSGEESMNLSGWSLRRKSAGDTTATGSSLKTFSASDTIPAHNSFLWANSGGTFKDHADTTTGSSLADNNSLALYNKNNVLIDSLTWGTGHALPYSPTLFGNPDDSESFIRDLTSLVWTKTKNPTPTNAKGEIFTFETSPTETGASPYKVLINEVLPNPKEKGDTGEFIELYNPGEETVSLSGWEIHDASVTGKYVFPNDTHIAPLSYLVVTDQDFSLSLNNSNEVIALWDREKRLVHRVHYEKTKEGVALNFVAGILRGARKPTPGTLNSENADPVTKERVPKRGYRNFAIKFQARGKDRDGDKLKFTWDFGDGHKSYKENTSHKYLKSGSYTVTLTTDDGIDTTRETFGIKIKKYEAPKVRIISFVPNPKGNDSELEWIEIENREKREVNLKDFSIATGTKKKSIANHPIREDFIIPPNSIKRLTREGSLFTLGNIRSHIELRSPDGETIQRLKYKYAKSLAENTVLKKGKGASLLTLAAPTEPEGSIAKNANENLSMIPVEGAADERQSVTNALTLLPVDETPSQNSSLLPPLETTVAPAVPSLEPSSPISVWPEKFHLVSSLLGLSRVQSALSSYTHRLTDWPGHVNELLNNWLARTSIATKETE